VLAAGSMLPQGAEPAIDEPPMDSQIFVPMLAQ